MGKVIGLVALGIGYGVTLAIGFRLGNKIADAMAPHAQKAWDKTKEYAISAYSNINTKKEVPNVSTPIS